MAAVTGRAAGYIAELWYSATVLTTRTEAGIDTLIGTAANQVIDVSSMGAIQSQRQIIDIPVYGNDTAGKLPGQADPGTFDFTVTLNLNNTVHTSLRDDNGRTRHSFVIVFDQATAAQTYAIIDGYVASANVNQAIDGAITMDVSIARDGSATWVDDSA